MLAVPRTCEVTRTHREISFHAHWNLALLRCAPEEEGTTNTSISPHPNLMHVGVIKLEENNRDPSLRCRGCTVQPKSSVLA